MDQPAAETPEPPVVRTLRRIDARIGSAEQIAVAIALLVLVGVGLWHSFSKYARHENLSWPFEVVRYSVFWIALLGAALAAQRSSMMSMDVVTRLLSPRKKVALRLFASAVVIFLVSLVCWFGYGAWNRSAGGSYDVIPPRLGLLALPVGAGLIVIHELLHGICDILTFPKADASDNRSTHVRVH